MAYDSLGMYQQLAQAGCEPRSPEGWAATRRYAAAISAILAADGVRCGWAQQKPHLAVLRAYIAVRHASRACH